MPPIFISRSHKDEVWKNSLLTILKILQHKGTFNKRFVAYAISLIFMAFSILGISRIISKAFDNSVRIDTLPLMLASLGGREDSDSHWESKELMDTLLELSTSELAGATIKVQHGGTMIEITNANRSQVADILYKAIRAARDADNNMKKYSQEEGDTEVDADMLAKPVMNKLREETEPVLLGVSTPRAVKPGDIFTARFFAYIKSLEETVKKEIYDLSHGRSELHMGIESCRWKLETKVTVKLLGKYLKVDPSESEFVWKGERNLVNFFVEVFPDAPEGWTVLQYEVFIEGIRVAFIPLDLEITSRTKSDKRNIATIEPAHTAFASYASQDRMRVLDRVAAVRISAGLDIFMDCLSIHPGEEWKKRLESEIEKRELFLLFWSVNAINSQWVTWEWKTALAKKGESALQIHPLQTVTEAPPPEELKKFHFGDIYMIVHNAQEKEG